MATAELAVRICRERLVAERHVPARKLNRPDSADCYAAAVVAVGRATRETNDFSASAMRTRPK